MEYHEIYNEKINSKLIKIYREVIGKVDISNVDKFVDHFKTKEI